MTDDKKLRVVMLIQVYYPHPAAGGAESQLKALAPLLQERGIDVQIVTRRYTGLEPFELIDNIPVHRLPIPRPKALASLSYTFHALKLIRQLKPQVIHAHELLSPGTTAVMARRLFGIPIVAKVLRGGTLGDLAKLQHKTMGQYRIRSFARYMDGFAVISQEINRELDSIGVSADRRHFIPNGVNTGRFAPLTKTQKKAKRSELGLADIPTVIFTGRLAPEKRVDELLRIWTQLDIESQLVIVGTGPEEDRLKDIASKSNHPDRVIFTGRVDDVSPCLQVADIFVLPSKTEGLSNALLEAMAVGLAPIVTRVGGAPDLIEHQKTGWLIFADDLRGLDEGLRTLLQNPERVRVMGQAAKDIILKNYTLETTAERLVSLYRQLAR